MWTYQHTIQVVQAHNISFHHNIAQSHWHHCLAVPLDVTSRPKLPVVTERFLLLTFTLNHIIYYGVFDNQHEVPAIDTEYYCSFHNPPKLDSKHHVISVSKIKIIFAMYFKHFTEASFPLTVIRSLLVLSKWPICAKKLTITKLNTLLHTSRKRDGMEVWISRTILKLMLLIVMELQA